MFEIARTGTGVPILLHWSVPPIALFVLGAGMKHPVSASAWIVGYLAIIVIHELGHQIAAERRGLRVFAIHVYPMHGRCLHEAARSPKDALLVAIGGWMDITPG